MSSDDAVKKRRVDDDDNRYQGEDSVPTISDAREGDGLTLAAIMAKMNEMQNEVDSMKSRLSDMDKLEDKCKNLEDKCGSMERSMKILIKEQKWEYSAPDIPESYWRDKGFDEDYIAQMNYFIQKIQKTTSNLRNNEVIYILLGNSGHDTVLLHDDILLPHWKEIANALQLYQTSDNFTIENFHLDYLQLSSSVISLLTPALKGDKIINFYLGNNDFANIREGIEFAVEIIESICVSVCVF